MKPQISCPDVGNGNNGLRNLEVTVKNSDTPNRDLKLRRPRLELIVKRSNRPRSKVKKFIPFNTLKTVCFGGF